MLGVLMFTLWALWTPPQSSVDYAPAPPDLHARIALGSGKTIFRQGERVPFVLTLSADKPGYLVDPEPDYPAFAGLTITPDAGVFHWLDRYANTVEGDVRDYGSRVDLSWSPVRMEGAVNRWVRFDAPGDYAIRLTVFRVHREHDHVTQYFKIETNPVTFHVVVMTDAEEAAEAQRLVSQIRNLNDRHQPSTIACEDLTFLAGRAATDALIQNLERAGVLGGNEAARSASDCASRLPYGPFISRYPEAILSAAERLLSDVARPPESSWLGTATYLRHLIDQPPGSKARFLDRFDPICRHYLDLLGDSIEHREGTSQLAAAKLLIDFEVESAPPAAVKAVIEHFDELSPDDQLWLLSGRWDVIRDRRLAPAVRRLLARDGDPTGFLLEPLVDVVPELARPRAISIIQNLTPGPGRDTVLSRLPDAELPEVDDALLHQFELLVSEARATPRKCCAVDSTDLIARFATSRILSDVQRLYDENAAVLSSDTRGYVLAYLFKHDPDAARRRIQTAAAEVSAPDEMLEALARQAYSPTVDALVVSRLESADPDVLRRSIETLRLYAPSSSRSALVARLERWLAKWASRREELAADVGEARTQNDVQIELIAALSHATHWTAPQAEIDKLLATCVTTRCRQMFVER